MMIVMVISRHLSIAELGAWHVHACGLSVAAMRLLRNAPFPDVSHEYRIGCIRPLASLCACKQVRAVHLQYLAGQPCSTAWLRLAGISKMASSS